MSRRQYKTIYQIRKDIPGMVGSHIYGYAETEELAKDEVKRLTKSHKMHLKKYAYLGNFFYIPSKIRVK